MRLVVPPLEPGREALVEPDVAPAPHRDVVADPLVGQLVHHDGPGVAAVAEEGVGRAALVLQREAGEQRGGHPARGAEGVVAELGLEPADDARAAAHQPHRHGPAGRLQALRDGVEVGQAVRDTALGLEPPGGEEGEVGRHRPVHPPAPGVPAAGGGGGDQVAVADRLLARRDRDGDVEGGLVARVVVGGEPPGRDLRLVGGERLGLGGDPGHDAPAAHVLGRAVVVHRDGEHGAGPDRAGGCHHELVAVGLGRADRGPVDPDRVDGQHQVEVEPRQVLRRARGERRRAGQRPGGQGVAHVDGVVPHVVAAVAVDREVGVPDAGRPGLRRARACLGGTDRGGGGARRERRHGGEGGQPAGGGGEGHGTSENGGERPRV